jgi:Protein of unknown function (DUF3616)
MNRPTPILSLLALCTLLGAVPPVQGQPSPVKRYEGMCDASTAVAIGADRFLVSNDEKNKLWLYSLGQAAPVREIDISEHLAFPDGKEADIEGSALLGEAVYWITSHGRNKDGEIKRDRFQIFALTPRVGEDGDVSLVPTGRPYKGLMADMLAVTELRELGLAPLSPETDLALAPEAEKGTNIEGLAAWQNDQLLIAFRNPIPEDKALLVPLQNPARVLAGEKARFGQPIRLDLGGLGIRSIERRAERAYVIVAGARDDCPAFQLFLWSGDPAKQPERVPGADLFGLRPEAIVVYPSRRGEVLLLSDDGGVRSDGVECKKLPVERRAFRAMWVPVPGLAER